MFNPVKAARCLVTIMVVLAAFSFSLNAVPEQENRELEFLAIKSKGDYSEALKYLGPWTRKLSDDSLIEINLLRIEDLIIYPELCDTALDVLESLASNERIKNSPQLNSRFHQVLREVYLKKGRLAGAARLLREQGYLSFHAVGPFDSRGMDSFERQRGPEQSPREAEYRGKYCPVSWYETQPDRSGIIDIDGLFHDTRESAFYFFTTVAVPSAGEYSIILGKCGYTDVYLDDAMVFSNRSRHGFYCDQYSVRVFMEKGPHRICIKTGDSSEGVKLSARITDAAGWPVRITQLPLDENPACTQSRALSAGLYPVSLNRGNETDADLFRKAYLVYGMRLSSEEDREAETLLEGIEDGSRYYSCASYYLGRLEQDELKKRFYLNNACLANPLNMEAFHELALLKTDRKQLYEAGAVIDSMKKNMGPGPLYLDAMARLCLAKGWKPEALKYIRKLRTSPLPSRGIVLDAEIHEAEKSYDAAAAAIGFLAALDRYNENLLFEMSRLSLRAGKVEQAKKALYHAIATHPAKIVFRVLLADVLREHGTGGGALSCLIAGLSISPYNRDVLSGMAREYLDAGNRDLAEYYIRRALEVDPENSGLRRHLAFIANNEIPRDRYRCDETISALKERARQYNNEPAVVLLDESVTWLNADGSKDTHVRRIIQVNDDSVVDEFSVQHVVFSPETETVENLLCSVWSDGSAKDISERYIKSLSDPESRLYYDLSALVIPVPSLAKGGVVDLSYTLRQKGGDVASDSFGEMVLLGGNYRTMVFNHVIAAPGGKALYCHADRSHEKAVTRTSYRNHVVYRVAEKNIPPYKAEVAMPDESAFLPRIVFTSFSSWAELIDWYRSLLAGRKIVNEQMRRVVRDLVSGTDDPVEKVKRIYDHVVSEVRYVGFELGIGGIQPRRSDLTYLSRMGDCKDVALLLKALLEEAGVAADLALVRTADRGAYDQSVPFLGFFNHAICCVNLGEPLFLDATADHAGFRDLPGDDREITALVLGEGRYRFVPVSGTMYTENRVIAENVISIDRDGTAVIQRRLTKEGISAPGMRAGLENSGKKVKSLMEYWNRKYPGAVVEGLEIIRKETDVPAEYRYSVTVPSYGEKAGDDIIFRPYLVTSDYFSNYAFLGTRNLPLYLAGSGRTEIINTYVLPDDYRVYAMPESEKFQGADFEAEFTGEVAGNNLIVRATVMINKPRMNSADYTIFREFARFVDRKEHERIILVRKNDGKNRNGQR